MTMSNKDNGSSLRSQLGNPERSRSLLTVTSGCLAPIGRFMKARLASTRTSMIQSRTREDWMKRDWLSEREMAPSGISRHIK